MATARSPDWGASAGGPRHLRVRDIVVVGGIFIWVGSTLLGAGLSTIPALLTNLVLVAGATAIGSGTRTIRVRVVAVGFLLGGFSMSVMYLIARGLLEAAPRSTTALDWMVIPPLEELAKIAPVVALLWWGRRTGTWALAATDVLLLGIAAGAGFAFVEDAYIRSRFGWSAGVAWLPTSSSLGSRMIAGHAVWTGVVAGFLGLALLVRWRKPVAGLLVAVGAAVALSTHMQNNYAADQGRSGSSFGDLFATITAHGWLSVVLLVLVAAACVGADLAVRFILSDPLEPRRTQPPVNSPLARWLVELDRRASAMAAFQTEHATPARQPEVRSIVHAYGYVVGAVSIVVIVVSMLQRHGPVSLVGAILNVGANGTGLGPLGGAGAGGAAAGLGGDGGGDPADGDGDDGSEDDDC